MTGTRKGALASAGLAPPLEAPMGPSNTERRLILTEQHAHLRQTIAAAVAAARDTLASRGRPAELQAAIGELERELLAHLLDEERLLVPILGALDAWGPVRLGLLQAEHAHQRAVLAVLRGPGAGPASPLVAGRTLSLCEDLLVDMQFEERELLNERVLHDDLVLRDASDC